MVNSMHITCNLSGYIIWIVTFHHRAFTFTPGTDKLYHEQVSAHIVIKSQPTNYAGEADGLVNTHGASKFNGS